MASINTSMDDIITKANSLSVGSVDGEDEVEALLPNAEEESWEAKTESSIVIPSVTVTKTRVLS